MDEYEYDEEEKARRKKAQVEYRNKRNFSYLFILLATIFEIVESFVLIVLLVLGTLSIFSLVVKHITASEALISNIAGIIIIVDSIGGIVLGFIIYKKLINWFINKFNLNDKLLDDVKIHYVKQTPNIE